MPIGTLRLATQVLLTAVLLALLSGAARAASPEPGDAVYHALRYNDDPVFWTNPDRPPDLWDKLKYIPIGDGRFGPSYLGIGGEVRERLESYRNPNFGLKAPPSNVYLLQRLLLNLDARITDYIRVFAQLGEFDRLGNRGASSICACRPHRWVTRRSCGWGGRNCFTATSA